MSIYDNLTRDDIGLIARSEPMAERLEVIRALLERGDVKLSEGDRAKLKNAVSFILEYRNQRR